MDISERDEADESRGKNVLRRVLSALPLQLSSPITLPETEGVHHHPTPGQLPAGEVSGDDESFPWDTPEK